MVGLARLTKTGPDSWAAADGGYTVTRTRTQCGPWPAETSYHVVARRHTAGQAHAVTETLGGARDAITAWEASEGQCWHLHLVTGSRVPDRR